MAVAKFTIALAGNPNCGKTTLFNRLTGSNQKVGNWPGVTVDRKAGTYAKNNPSGDKEYVNVVDLPGIYSLTPYSEEEIIARNFIVDENPDLVINIVDATNLARNLYLTLQLKKLGSPMIVALNMMDEVEQNGTVIDFDKLSELLGVPVIPISALEGKSFSEKIAKLAGYKSSKIAHGGIEKLIAKTNDILDHSFKYYQNDLSSIPASGNKEKIEVDSFDKKKFDPSILKKADTINYDEHSAEIYSQVDKIIESTVREGKKSVQQERTKGIDSILTHKWLGIPLFLLIMGLVFQLSFGVVGSFFTDLIDVFLNETLAGFVEDWFVSAGTSDWMTDLVINGIIAGVGGVLTFVPQVVILFIFLTLLEDTGYMARVAFLMDRVFNKMGLSGKSFIPLLISFGCGVPGVMAARSLDNEMDRKTTIFISPFMICGARLPIYAMFIGTFFAAYEGIIMLILYVFGLVIAVLSAFLLKKTIFRGPSSPFIMELPPYRFPDFYTYIRHIWDKARAFMIKAGTIIFLMSIVIWFFQGYDFTFTAVDDPAESIFGIIGSAIAPLFEPLGYGDWRAAVSLMVGLIAKEAVVSAMEILFAPGEFEAVFNTISAFSFMVFVIFYLPCIAAFGTAVRELNSWKWALAAGIYQTGVAFILAFLVYQIGMLLFPHLA